MRKNCFILGCGRSGTSCLAGSVASSGYNIGGVGHAGNKGNPRGYFETKEVNNINDTMLFEDSRSIFTHGSRHGWLTMFPVGICPSQLPNTEARIKSIISSEPFCLKDPRFSYTLPVWKKYLPKTYYVCVFRHPGAVVNSMMKNCETAPYLSKIKIDRSICYHIWRLMYAHLLHHAELNWLFLHYNQILDGTGLDRVESLLDTKVNRNFPTKTLCRSEKAFDIPTDIRETYRLLCSLAKYKGAK